MKKFFIIFLFTLFFNCFGEDDYFLRDYLPAGTQNYFGPIAEYSEAIKLEPGNSELYCSRAKEKEKINDLNGAIADYTKAIKLEPKSSELYCLRAQVKRNIKDYYGAVSDYTQAIKLKPENFSFYMDRGNCKFELRDYKGAKSDYIKSANGNHVLVKYRLNILYKKINLKERLRSGEDMYYNFIDIYDCIIS